jgi:hypothetical protein
MTVGLKRNTCKTTEIRFDNRVDSDLILKGEVTERVSLYIWEALSQRNFIQIKGY